MERGFVMQKAYEKEIAKELVTLNMNIWWWNRGHMMKSFHVNGKNENGLLTMQQFHVLMFMKSTGVNTVSELCKWLHLSKSSMSIMISNLEKMGYLYKQQADDADDGRKVYLHLTQMGKETVAKAEENVLEDIASCFTSFSEEAQTKICTNLKELNKMLKAGGFEE